MNAYIQPLITAMLIFPFIAIIFTLPYIIIQYRKYGAILFTRSVIVYSLILYLLCAYFLVVLPLPKHDIVHYSNPMQLIPFNFINDYSKFASKISSIKDVILIIKNPVVYQAIFNLLLTLPLGVYLRYYFNRKWYQCLIIVFLVSLSFETIQLTGILGLYNHPYRLFDVDDLMINTLGGMLGFILTPLITKWLPTKEQLDHKSYLKGQSVSFNRRLFAFVFDQIIINSIYLFIIKYISIGGFNYIVKYLIEVFLYYGVLMFVFKGQTFGKMLVKIKVVNNDGSNVDLQHLLFRYSIIFLFYSLVPNTIITLIRIPTNNLVVVKFIVLTLLIVIYCIFIFRVLILTSIKHITLLHEELTNTKNISVVEGVKDD